VFGTLDYPSFVDLNASPMGRKLTTFDEVADALGGLTALAHLTGRRLTAVSNWRCQRGRFPARMYLVVEAALNKRGLTAAPDLFGFEQPPIRRVDEPRRNKRV
jgi:hypothetical protein